MPLPILADTTPASLTTLGTAFSQITTWMGSIVSTITADALYMVALAIWVVGAVIGLGYRLIRGG